MSEEIGLMTPAQRRKHMDLQVIKGEFNLEKMSLEDLAKTYTQVEGRIQLVKGQILLAARKRFSSDLEFGYWVRDNGLDDVTQQVRYGYMRLAEFYSHRDMTGMSPTVCIKIAEFAAMENCRDLAMKAHNHAHGRNMSKQAVVDYIKELKENMYVQKPKIQRFQQSPVIDVTAEYSITSVQEESPPIITKQQLVEVYQEAEDTAQDNEEDVQLILDLLKDKPLKLQEAILKTCELRLMEQLL